MLVHTSMGCMAILVQTSMGYMAIFLPSNSKYLFILVIADPYWGMAVKKYNSNQYQINIYLMPDPERASQAERITLTKLSKGNNKKRLAIRIEGGTQEKSLLGTRPDLGPLKLIHNSLHSIYRF